MKKLTRPRIDAFIERYRTDGRTLDIGCGTQAYDRFFPNRLTADIDPNRNPDLIADVHALPFSDGEFDAVLCTEVLEHTLDPVQAIREMMRVLKPGGTLILTTRFVWPIHDAPGDYWRFTRYNLLRLFSAWTVLEIRSELPTFSTIAALLQRVIFQTRLRFNRPVKVFLLAFVHLFNRLNFLIIEEYGDIGRTTRETDILTTGYHIAVRK